MAEILENASSRFFDSVIKVDKITNAYVGVSFFMKFKDNFSWPWNSGENIYTSPSCNKDIGELKIPEGDINKKNPIRLKYKDDKGTQHNCSIVSTSYSSVLPQGSYKILYNYYDDGPHTDAEAAVKLDELLNMMAKGEVYGEKKGFGYKLKWHPFPNELQAARAAKYNESARENALVSTDEEIQELLAKYGE